MNENPYESPPSPPELPPRPTAQGRPFPWRRLLIGSSWMTAISFLVAFGLRPIREGRYVVVDTLRHVLIACFLLGFLVMVISFVGKRHSEIFRRNDRS